MEGQDPAAGWPGDAPLPTGCPAVVGKDEDYRAGGIVVDSAAIPGGGRLQLVRHENDYEILVDNEQLMSSWSHRSEEALATFAFARLTAPADRILIGGLGMGFTLAATRAASSAIARIVVAELIPQVVVWANGPLAHIFGKAFDDPRVAIEMRDVHDIIVRDRSGFDVILLDVDNGPDGFVTAANERLYCN